MGSTVVARAGQRWLGSSLLGSTHRSLALGCAACLYCFINIVITRSVGVILTSAPQMWVEGCVKLPERDVLAPGPQARLLSCKAPFWERPGFSSLGHTQGSLGTQGVTLNP